MEIEKIEDLEGAIIKNAYYIRLFHIFINYFYASACNITNIAILRATLNSRWSKSIQDVDFSSYYNLQSFDKKFQYLSNNHKYLYMYFVIRCMR